MRVSLTGRISIPTVPTSVSVQLRKKTISPKRRTSLRMKVRPNGVYDTMRTNGTDLYREIRPNASRKIQYKHEYKTPSVIPTTADIISTALREETKISRLGQHYNGVALYRCNRLAEYSTALYTRIIITITIITFYALWRYVNIVQAAIYYIYIYNIFIRFRLVSSLNSVSRIAPGKTEALHSSHDNCSV